MKKRTTFIISNFAMSQKDKQIIEEKSKKKCSEEYDLVRKRLRDLRLQKGLFLDDVANALGTISSSSIRHYETGIRKPKLETLQKLADFYEVDIRYLFGEIVNPVNTFLKPNTIKSNTLLFFKKYTKSSPKVQSIILDLLDSGSILLQLENDLKNCDNSKANNITKDKTRTVSHAAKDIFPTRLQQLAEEKHISYLNLAKELNIGHSTILAYKNGIRFPSAKNQEKIASYFKVDRDYLMGISSTPSSIEEIFNISKIIKTEADYRLAMQYQSMDKRTKKAINQLLDLNVEDDSFK